MMPTPKRLPLLTTALLAVGMAVFIVGNYLPAPVEKVLGVIGIVLFSAGMLVALVGTLWSIGTLTSSVLRRKYGITTPVFTILIAAFAWSGALWTLHKFRQSVEVRAEEKATRDAEAARELE